VVLDILKDRFRNTADQDAIVYQDETYNYEWILNRWEYWQEKLEEARIFQGSVVALKAGFSPNSVALLLALIGSGSIVVPLTSCSAKSKQKELLNTAKCQHLISQLKDDNFSIEILPWQSNHEHYEKLRAARDAGLVLFSSGSTGSYKAAVHNFIRLLDKFNVHRHCYRTLSFLLFDHIGGINTLFYTLFNSGCIVTVQDRSPEEVLKTIERYSVELLPTSPTFINLILLSEAYKSYDIRCLKLLTYGTEPMPEGTLKRFHQLFPDIKLLQTYGLSELGILRSKSKSSDSLWVKIGGEGFQTRVVNGTLQIKAKSAMLGYLNAESPYTEDGWMETGDSVQVDGEYIKILGRKSQIINVGGEKVFPAEVEGVIKELDDVAEVTVYGEKNAILGNIVCAKVRPTRLEDKKRFTLNLKRHCRDKLEKYKVPVKVFIGDEIQYTDRYKKKIWQRNNRSD
jgi:acyl-CoA synthetase (AMP-forming)/AMP-acid ligase II